MTGARRFISSRTLAGLDTVRIDDRPVIETFERLVRILGQSCGHGVAALFAEPVISRANGAAPARVDWYTTLEGPVRPLADLDPVEADRLRGRIRDALSAMEPALHDPDVGAFVAACLNLAAPLAILAVGTAPLLIDWGLLPHGLTADAGGRARHHAGGLGAFAADLLPCPPIGREAWRAGSRPATAAIPAAIPDAVPPAGPHGAAGRAARVGAAPVIAAALAAGLLALSYVPGVLVFGRAPQAASGEARAMHAAWLEGLRRRRETLAAADGLACPNLRSELPALVPQSPAGIRLPTDSAAPPQARASVEGPVAPLDPGRSAVPEAGGLVDRLERSTVLILAGDATGSGFYVADDLVVTNRHVVEGAPSVMIAGRHAGVIPAAVVRVGEPGTLTDFALLRVAPRAGGRPLPLAVPGRPLTPVVGAGFPGLYLGTDPTFARLKDGDAAASRDLVPVLQTGVINHLQRYDEAGVTLVLHGAEIAPGNSGGPLVDYCGRVVGVNTFGRTDDRLPVTARYALGADGLAAFLAAAGVTAAPDPRPCDLQAAARVATAADPAAAATSPAPIPAPIPAPASPAGQAAPSGAAATPPDARTTPRTGGDARPAAR